MIITWGADEVAPWLILLDKIVQSEESEMEGGGGKGVRGNHSHLSEQLSWFSVCGPAAPVVLHTLMILCLLSPLLGMMVFIDYLCVTDPGGCCVFFLFFFGCCFFDHLASSGEFYRPIGKV